jgi:hypothetical protein
LLDRRTRHGRGREEVGVGEGGKNDEMKREEEMMMYSVV